MAGMRSKFQALREMPEDQRAKAAAANRAEMRAKITDILKPEQKPKYEAILAELAGRGAAGGGTRARLYVLENGLPKAIDVRLASATAPIPKSRGVISRRASRLSSGERLARRRRALHHVRRAAHRGSSDQGSTQFMNLIEVRDLTKTYSMGDQIVKALAGVTLCIEQGEFVAIMGPSGSGKSTFMNLIGCLDSPSAGSYKLAGEEVSGMERDQLAGIRNRRIGFVFQHFNLLARTTALDNVILPLLYSNVDKRSRVERAEKRLRQVGLGDRIHHTPSQLSGGQQQRVAIARALVNDPVLLLADEPTGALDSRTSIEVMALFQDLHSSNQTVVMVTHEADVARLCEPGGDVSRWQVIA